MHLLPILIAVLALPLSNAHHHGRAADEIEASVKAINDKIDEVIGADFGKESFLQEIKKTVNEGKARHQPIPRPHWDRYEGGPRSAMSFRSAALDGYSGIRAGTHLSRGIRQRSEKAEESGPTFRSGGFGAQSRTLALTTGDILPKIQRFMQNLFNVVKKLFGRMKWAFNYPIKNMIAQMKRFKKLLGTSKKFMEMKIEM